MSLVVVAPASGAIVINEVQSDDPTGGHDWVELRNTDVAAVDISNYVVKDNNDGHQVTIPGGTSIDPGGYYAIDTEPTFGLGSADSARVFDAGAAHLLDSYTWTADKIATHGRCPESGSTFTWTVHATKGAVNACPSTTDVAWPGSATTSVADDVDVFGQNLSGLAYQPSGTSARGVLWAVRNSASTLFRLVYDGTKWTPDTANGWANGKTLHYPNTGGAPDGEGVTFAGGDTNGIYVSVERDGANGAVSRPGVLRYDVTAAGTDLNATQEWNLTPDLPGLGSNLGLEAIAWVPDDNLVAKGFLDEATGLPYNPATYPDHGNGLFFVGVEQDGRIIAYALKSDGTFTRVATIASGFPAVMDLEYEPETTKLWAVCDDSCDGRTERLDVAQSGVNDGKFVVSDEYDRPSGMANLNNEGFAIAPQAECVGGLKPTFYSDDTNDDLHAIRTGFTSCTVPPAPPGGGGGGGSGGGGGGGSGGGGGGGPQPTIDRTAPSLGLALKFAKKGTYAVRRTGKFGVTITLGEKANLTFSATARKNSKAKARTILKRTTKKNIAAGKRTITFKLTSAVRKKLKKGETVTLTVEARDAAGNVTKKSVKAKVL